MAKTFKSFSSIFTLSEKASKKLDKILSEPLSLLQQQSYHQSIGVYASHKAKWKAKKK